MAIETRGSIDKVSKTFPEVIAGYEATTLRAIEKILSMSIEQGLGKAGTTGTELEGDAAGYAVELLKHYLVRWAPELSSRGEQAVLAFATKVAKETSSGLNLFAFCRVHALDPVGSKIRLVNQGVNFAQASRYYDWKGTMAEAYRGSLFTPIEDRREFVVYIPDRRLGGNADLSLKVTNTAHKP